MAKRALGPRVDLQLNVNNLTNEYYFDQMHPAHIVPGPGRTALRRSELQVLARGPTVLLTIPDAADAGTRSATRVQRLDEADWVDGRVTAGPQSARAKDNEQLPEDHPVGAAARRRDSRRARTEPAVHLGGAAVEGVSAALQPLPRRTRVRHARGQRDPPDRRHARTASAPICRRRCFCRRRTSTTAANCRSRTPTACTA